MVEQNTILDIDAAVICTSRLPLWYSLHLLVTTGENLTCVQTLACLLPFHPLQVLKRDPDEIRPRMELWEISATIAASLNHSNYAAVHVRRGNKARDKKRWPHLDDDTKPDK